MAKAKFECMTKDCRTESAIMDEIADTAGRSSELMKKDIANIKKRSKTRMRLGESEAAYKKRMSKKK